MNTMTVVLVLGCAAIGGGLIVWLLIRLQRGGVAEERVTMHSVAGHVRAVGKLVGLEVNAKEIATATKGWSWLPPLLLSQARVAMIFHFEKQYFMDLSGIDPDRVEDLGGGKFVLTLPEIQSTLHLINVTPYDIQDGRILGLLDVIQINAQTQDELMRRAQEQAGKMLVDADDRYRRQARESIERQLKTFLSLLDVQVQIRWGSEPVARTHEPLRAGRESLIPSLA